MGLVLIGAGLVVFRYSAYIAGQLASYISPPPTDGNNITGLVSPGGWYLPYAVWGFGFTLIGLGGTMLRSAFTSAVMGGAGGAMGGGAGMSPCLSGSAAGVSLLEAALARALAPGLVPPITVTRSLVGSGAALSQANNPTRSADETR